MANTLSPNRTIRSKPRGAKKSLSSGKSDIAKRVKRRAALDHFLFQDPKQPTKAKFCKGEFKGTWLHDCNDRFYLMWVAENVPLSSSLLKAVTGRIKWLKPPQR